MRWLALALALLAWPAVAQVELEPRLALPIQRSAAGVSNLVLTGQYKSLVTMTITIGATSGYVMVLDATALPANGAVNPLWCRPVTSNGTNGALSAEWKHPLQAANGLVLAFSTTGCDTLTASTTAKFMAQAI